MWNVLPRQRLTTSRWKGISIAVCRRCMATVAPHDPRPIPLVSQSVRTRFAPSPTGSLHLGGLRTALFNYLLAKHYGGQFILRIENTDTSRTVEGAVEELCEMLKWAGIEWDEGPGIGGVQGPYLQSERIQIYKGLSDCLIDSQRAYRCFCSTKRLEEIRERGIRHGHHRGYDRHCYNTISGEESRRFARGGKPHVVRLLAPDTWPTVNDYLRGDVHFPMPKNDGKNIFYDDQIILKTDGWPTYHLANVVDDHLMEISHVIRGEEWLSSTPKHLVLYDAFGWKPPVFVHLPLLHDMTGRKLSKRYVESSESFMIKDYKADGVLPEALINWVALFGWSAKTESDVHTKDDLISRFSLDGLTSGSLIVSTEKLPFLSHKHILLMLKTEEGTRSLASSALPYLKEHLSDAYTHYLGSLIGLNSEMPSLEYLMAVIRASHERIHTLQDVYNTASYFFRDPNYSKPALIDFQSSHDPFLFVGTLTRMVDKIAAINEWNYANISTAIKQVARDMKQPSSKVMKLLRGALAGLESGVGVPAIVEILGKEKTIRRIEKWKEFTDVGEF